MEDYGITNEQLKEFCQWYASHFQKKETYAAGMSISAAGYFHLSNKDAGKLLDRCNSIGLIKKRRENIVILVGGDVVRERLRRKQGVKGNGTCGYYEKE